MIDRVVTLALDTISGSRYTKRMWVIIALDLRNTFNSVRIVSSYLTDWTLLYETDNGTHTYNIAGGIPQGSVVGSLIWNVLYNGLLKQPLPDAMSIIAYADNVDLVIVAKTIDEV